MDQMSNIICPVCTLFLRPGMTLESHLTSHPKQKVIEALIKLSQLGPQNVEKLSISNGLPSTSDTAPYPQLSNVSTASSWHHPTTVNVNPMAPNLNHVPANHSFIYQQFMSSSGTQPVINVNPMAQQFVAVPTVINPQMFCSPYVFQQQQQLQIVSTNPNVQPILPRPPLGLMSNDVEITPVTNSLNNENSSSAKILETSITEQESACVVEDTEKVEDNIQTNEDIIEEEEDKEEAIEVYPDMYANGNTAGLYEPRSTQPLEEDEIECDKSNEQIIEIHQTEVIDEIEIIEMIDISKADENKDVNSELHESVGMPELIPKPLALVWEMKNDDDLNKACQTTQPTSYDEDCTENKKTELSIENNNMDFCTTEEVQTSEEVVDRFESVTVPAPDIQIDNDIYGLSKDDLCMPSSSNVLIQNDNVTLLEINDMNFMITNEFIQSGKTILSKVEDYECIKDGDGTKVLMNIGEERCELDDTKDVKRYCDDKLCDESMSRESLNIHADERMPPRGELSEQESNGASDITWGKVYHEQECSSGVSTSYDLLARESWEASDCSDSEMPPLQSRIPPSNSYIPEPEPEFLEIPIKKSPVVSYSCTTCEESFSCPKERRVHQSKEHGASSNTGNSKKIIKVRQTRKPKATVVKQENNFELFAKVEPTNEADVSDESPPVKEETDLDVEIKSENLLCNMCGELCPSHKEFNKHLHRVHKIISEKHKCKTCLEVFPSQGKFTEHLKIHPLECNVCGKNFYRRNNLYIHLKRHYNIRPYKCETCSKAFLTKQKLQEHTNVHTRNSPIKCTMCDETFRRHSNLVQHRNKHHFNIKKKYKDYVCHCGEVFHSKNKLSWHKEIHDTKPKACTYCHEKFVHVSSLTRHIRRSHNQNYVPKGKKDTENVECHICKGVYFKNSLEVHLKTHSGDRKYSCLICGKEFTTKWNLKLHRWTHASRTSKPFKCDQCNGAFIRQADFQAHMNSHKSVRPYTCNYCGCKFIRKYNCQRHVREHEENKNYTCTVCNKSFHRSYYLKEHMRVHSGARPFACHICGKTSTTKSNHNKHMKIHHAREPVSTEG